MRTFVLWVSLFPLLGAIGMVAAGVRSRLTEPELRRTGEGAVGTIVDSRSTTDESGRVVYHPVVTFRTQRGRSVRAVGDTVSVRPFPTDKAIAVVYDPRKPQTVLTGPARSRTYIVGGVVFAVIALALVVAAFVLS